MKPKCQKKDLLIRTIFSPFIIIVGGFFIFTVGCSMGPKYLAKDYVPPSRVAVLPFSNETNDVSGPETVRKLLIEMLPSRGYTPIEKKKVDQTLLEEFGITEGGQLASVSPQELEAILKVDGLFYGNILQFVDIPLGFIRKRIVKANVKLLDAKTGDLLWEDEKSGSMPEFHLSAKEAKKAVIRQIAERQIEKMRGTFLQKEARLMIEFMLRNLPLAR